MGTAVYEDVRRAKTKLPKHLRDPNPTTTGIRYLKHGWDAGTTRPDDGVPTVTCFFILSVDCEAEYRAELAVEAEVFERARARLGPAGLHSALLGVGLCAACWLLMVHPRRHIILARSLGPASAAQVEFWNMTVRGSMAEFFFLNRLPFYPLVVREPPLKDPTEDTAGPEEGCAAEPAATTSRADEEPAPSGGDCPAGAGEEACPPRSPSDGVLVPIGGGKDSLALLEVLRDSGMDMARDVQLFYLTTIPNEWRDNWRLAALHRASGVAECRRVCFIAPFRTAAEGDDEAAADLFAGADEGHLVEGTPPWAAMVCFAAALVAGGCGCGYIAVGNEQSANFGNGVQWLGEEVNHQFDKSFLWEQQAAQYLREHVSPGLHYFSGLMPWWEVQIAMRFAQADAAARYLKLFISCNAPAGLSRWCATCPKCCFVYLLLAAHLRADQVWAVFGENLFERVDLLPVFRALLALPPPAAQGAGGQRARGAAKPLECVGTAAEAWHSVALAARRHLAEPPPGCPSAAEGARYPRVLECLLAEMRASPGGLAHSSVLLRPPCMLCAIRLQVTSSVKRSRHDFDEVAGQYLTTMYDLRSLIIRASGLGGLH